MSVGEKFNDLVKIMDQLREPGGCPWDREQTYASLRSYLLEESYEVVEALDDGDLGALSEELGDLLLQIVFLSRLGKEDGAFTVEDVIDGISDKMVRRHPHIFGSARADSADEVLRQWEEIKRDEKRGQADATGHRPSTLAGIPPALPALMKAHRLGTKAARVGFDWSNEGEVLDKVSEELGELRSALDEDDGAGAREELGDLLFTLAMLGRRLSIDPEEALERANRKFRRRFNRVEETLARRGEDPSRTSSEELERLWEAAKARDD